MPPSTMKKGQTSEELRRVRNLELELKRISGEISCADCRRLKLKCDKKIPCSSCVRRGVESLCPLGFRASNSQSSRIVTTGRPFDHHRTQRKLTILCERISALEDALALESESRRGCGHHPLLSDGLLSIKQCVSDEAREDHEEEEEHNDHLLSAFGTLSIDKDRTMRYLGPAASESALLMEALENNVERLSIAGSPSSLTSKLIETSRAFPFASLSLSQSDGTLLAQLVTHLPSFERATALYEAFFRNLSWVAAPVERSQIISDLIPLFYPRRRTINSALVREEHAHDLALLFSVFACGSVGDLTQSPINDEAEQFHTMAKVALSVKNIMRGASLSGVQTVFLLGSYDAYSGHKPNQEDACKLFMLGSATAASIGLHRDPSRWGFDPKIVNRRRRVFWEIYLTDTCISMQTGRPSIFRPNVVDCEYPNDSCATLGEDGEVIESVYQWTYRFLHDILADVCERLGSARPIRYCMILEFDRKIRNFALHPYVLRSRKFSGCLAIDSAFEQLHPMVTTWFREETLIHIHRNFFARAILDFPSNPMSSPFAASFLATYRSACEILRICRKGMENMYLIILRVWAVWSLCLSCGVIVGAVASLGSSSNLATSALVELQYAISLFERFPEHIVARHGLPLLRRVRERAIIALRKSSSEQTAGSDMDKGLKGVLSIRGGNESGNEELLIMRGTTRVVEQCSAPASDASPADNATSSDTTYSPPETGSTAATSIISNQPTGTHSVDQVEQLPDQLPTNINPVQSTDTPLINEAYPWLAELEQILGLSGQSQVQSGVDTPDAEPAFVWHNTFPGQMASSQGSVPSNPPHPFTTGAEFFGSRTQSPNVLDDVLDESVTSDAWRSFMQQSGFSDSLPFDFGLDAMHAEHAFDEPMLA